MTAEFVDEPGDESPELRVVVGVVTGDDDPRSAVTGRRGLPQHARRGLGTALLGLALAGRFATGHATPISSSAEDLPARPALDVALGALDLTLEATTAVISAFSKAVTPVITDALEPGLRPARGIAGFTREVVSGVTAPLAERGARLRRESEQEAAAAVAAVLPSAMDAILDQIDLTDQVIGRVDLEQVIADTFDQVDVVNIMIDRVDLAPVVHASLAEVDLTDVAVAELDFERVVRETLDRVDVVALAAEQMDPARIAAFLNDNVDLSEILRTTPGGAVRGVMDTVGKIVPGRSPESR
ncbi:MAG: hypothetical protein KDC39_09385 [Actinobacteria bacterium]|nr:hypothetical protein [Actinomycetota bacterium]